MKQLTRGIIYLAGLAILALGITLNTKTGLGVSPIIAVAYAVSELWGTDFGNTVLLWYCVFVLVEIVLHGMKTHGRERTQKVILDVLQILNPGDGIVQTISDVSGKEVGRVIALFQHLFLKKIQEVFPICSINFRRPFTPALPVILSRRS